LKVPKIPYLYLLAGPVGMFVIGCALNSLVMVVNKNQMPVLIPGWHSELMNPDDLEHVAMTASTHLKFLADWILIGRGIASLGDFFIWAYDATFIPALAAWAALVLRDKKEVSAHVE
jgi:hypothetical protein